MLIHQPMKTKFLLLCTAISVLQFYSCYKNQPETTPNKKAPELAESLQNEFSVQEFEIELTAQLNTTGVKTKPTDVSYNKIKDVKVTINDLQVEMVTDTTGKISKSELQRVFTKVKNDVWAAAQNEFTGGKDRVLGFVLDEDIVLPPSAAGTITNIPVKVNGIIGNGVAQLPGCTFNDPHTWLYADPVAPGAMLDQLETILNQTSPPCVPNFFSNCPPPGKTERIITGTAVYEINGGDCMQGTPFICCAASMTLTCKQPCSDWYFTTTDLQNIVDNARQNSINWLNSTIFTTKYKICDDYTVGPAPSFDVGSFEEIDGTDKIRCITITYHYYGCGRCKAKSIRIRP